MPLDQNPHQRVTRSGCVGFSMYVCGFSVPQMRQFCLGHQDRNDLHRKRWYFLSKSASSVSRTQAHLTKRKPNWTLYGVIPRSLCKIRLNDVSEMFKCWERRRIVVDGASHILLHQQYCSRVYALFLASHALVYRCL